jgi:hypothetical protein
MKLVPMVPKEQRMAMQEQELPTSYRRWPNHRDALRL